MCACDESRRQRHFKLACNPSSRRLRLTNHSNGGTHTVTILLVASCCARASERTSRSEEPERKGERERARIANKACNKSTNHWSPLTSEFFRYSKNLQRPTTATRQSLCAVILFQNGTAFPACTLVNPSLGEEFLMLFFLCVIVMLHDTSMEEKGSTNSIWTLRKLSLFPLLSNQEISNNKRKRKDILLPTLRLVSILYCFDITVDSLF